MARTLLILLFCGFFSAAIAQNDSIIKYSSVVKVDTVRKEVLFQRARQWFNNSYKSSKDVLQIQDKETGELSGKANFESMYVWRYMGEHKNLMRVHFNINIYTKDGRYKYDLSHFQPEGVAATGNYEFPILTSSDHYPGKIAAASQSNLDAMWNEMKSTVDTQAQKIISGLAEAMHTLSGNDF